MTIHKFDLDRAYIEMILYALQSIESIYLGSNTEQEKRIRKLIDLFELALDIDKVEDKIDNINPIKDANS